MSSDATTSERSEAKTTTKKQQQQRFDKDTGAIFREVNTFSNGDAAKKSRRGYGKTPALDEHPLLKPQITMITGATGSGKTVLALNLLQEIVESIDHKKLGKIMFFTGSPSDPAIKSLNPDVVDVYSMEDEQKLIDDLNSLTQEMRQVEKEEDRPFNVLILDDFGSSKTLSPANIKGTDIGNALVSHRHISLHIILLAQRVKTMISPFVLANMSKCFIFAGKSKHDIDELFKNIPLARTQLDKAMSIIAAKPHGFLYIDLVKRSAMIGFDDVILS